MHTFRRGLLAGVLASLVLAMFDFVTDGTPGNGLPSVLHWFGITIADPTLSRWVGFFLLVVLGAVWGLIFELMLTNILNHTSSSFSLSFGRFLSSFPLDVLFGVLLGAIFIQWRARQAAETS